MVMLKAKSQDVRSTVFQGEPSGIAADESKHPLPSGNLT